MRLSDLPLAPSSRTLRQFAGLWILFLAAAACWHGLVRGHAVAGFVLAGLAATVGPLGLLWPRAIRPVFVTWLVLTFPIGWLMSKVLLAAAFYGIFTPLGILFRFVGRDILSLRFHPDKPTYWTPKTMPADMRQYFHQF